MSRIWLVPYGTNWSYMFDARGIAGALSDKFEIRIAPRGTSAQLLRAWDPDLAVDFWWGGQVRQMLPRTAVLKQISSHRWGHPRHGSMDARTMVSRHVSAYEGTLVPSVRLRDEMAAAGAPRVSLARKGYDPSLFGDEQRRSGDLVVGWAGDARAKDKRVGVLKSAEPGIAIADRKYAHSEMAGFYNRLDVITCASDAEGDPLTLIEGMACGCFPVTVDVGIVPELVRHDDNGLIVERTPEAFAAAFQWCRDNIDYVRAAGRRNAEQMLATRTWRHMAADWETAFSAALIERPPSRTPARPPARRHAVLHHAPDGPPLVTVALTYYRCREYLREAVDSILSQTMSRLVLVVINDGDPNQPWDLLADIDDPRLVRFDLPENRGMYFAADVVLRAARTPYFAIQDADDISRPHRLERLIAELEANNALSTSPMLGGERGLRIRYTSATRRLGRQLLHRYNHLGVQRTTELLDLGGYYGGHRIGWDTFLMNVLALVGESTGRPIAFVPDRLYDVRRREGSLTTAPDTGMKSQRRAAARREYAAKWERVFATRGTPDVTAAARAILTEDVPAPHVAELEVHAAVLRTLLDGIPAP